jgi:hypothetical protein
MESKINQLKPFKVKQYSQMHHYYNSESDNAVQLILIGCNYHVTMGHGTL